MAKIIIEGSPDKLAIIKNRFRSLGVKISEYTEQAQSSAVSEEIPPSTEPVEKVKRTRRSKSEAVE